MAAGPRLDRTEVGQKMVEFVLMRLKELAPGKYSTAAKSAMTEVEQLRANSWVQKLRNARKERPPRLNSKESAGTPKRDSKEEDKRVERRSSKDDSKAPTPKPKRFAQESFEYTPKGPDFRAAAKERGSILPAPGD